MVFEGKFFPFVRRNGKMSGNRLQQKLGINLHPVKCQTRKTPVQIRHNIFGPERLAAAHNLADAGKHGIAFIQVDTRTLYKPEIQTFHNFDRNRLVSGDIVFLFMTA